MKKNIKVRYSKNPQTYDCVSDIDLSPGDFVIIQTNLGDEIAEVVDVGKKNDKSNVPQKVLRKISAKEKKLLVLTDKERSEYLKKFDDLIKKHELSMKGFDVELSVGDKLVFYFSSDNRIDFRDLAKDLVRLTGKQSLLKQVGARDCARMIDGVGLCGRRLCCRQFLGVQEGVTLDMARTQSLSTKGTGKVTGNCCRLMCCLKFENKCYLETLKKMPKVGDTMKTLKGKGVVTAVNPVKNSVNVELDNNSNIEVSL